MHAKLNSFGAPSLLLLVVLCYQNVGGSPADAAPPNDLVVEVCHGHAHSNVGHTLRRRTIDSSYGSSVSRCPVEAGSSHQESCPSLQNYADARSDKSFGHVKTMTTISCRRCTWPAGGVCALRRNRTRCGKPTACYRTVCIETRA